MCGSDTHTALTIVVSHQRRTGGIVSRRQRLLFKTGCWVAIVTAIVHLIGYISGPQPPKNDVERVLLEQFTTYRFELPGGSRTLADFMSGFSLMFTVFLATFGALNLLVVRRCSDDVPLMATITRLDAACAVAMVVVSLSYFFLFPTICLAAIGVCFLGALVGGFSPPTA
jgi:hypothetical protein